MSMIEAGEANAHWNFSGSRVLVSGAAQGLGREIAASFCRAGATVHATDVDAAGLASPALGNCHTHVADVASSAAADTLLKDIGRVDVLVNAAGGVCGETGVEIENVTEASWQAIHSANVDTAFWLARAAVPAMKASGFGRIVLLSSGAGLRASLTGIAAYAAAKHAVVGLTRQLALELGEHGITVNSVAPGFVRSNPSTERQWNALGEVGQRKLVDDIHTRRLGSAMDIANAVLFLSASESGWITGQVLSVDGGRA